MTDSRHVSVIVPAFNEEKVIASTVERILESDHRDLEVIVVDDGSQDRTSEIVQNRFGNDSRVVLVCNSNGGKANALNACLKTSRREIIGRSGRRKRQGRQSHEHDYALAGT